MITIAMQRPAVMPAAAPARAICAPFGGRTGAGVAVLDGRVRQVPKSRQTPILDTTGIEMDHDLDRPTDTNRPARHLGSSST